MPQRHASTTAKSSPSPPMPTRRVPTLSMRVRNWAASAYEPTGRERAGRAVLQLVLLGALATPTGARQPLQVFGYAGVLGGREWAARVIPSDGRKDSAVRLSATQ